MERKRLFLGVAVIAGVVFCASLGIEFTGSPTHFFSQTAPHATTTLEYGVPIRITKVIDGDTVELEGGAHLRYVGMDTPEEFKPNTPVQCYAKEAAEENQKLVEGKMVTIYKDVSTLDMYGRYLGYVYLADGTFVNEALVKEGFAFAFRYKPDTSKAAEFAALEKEAKASGAGLWSACQVYKTASGREQTNAI